MGQREDDWATAIRRADREFRPLVQKAREAGWRVRVEGKHVKLFPVDPDMPPMTVPGSSGDRRRGLQNFRRDLRQRGLDV